MWRIFCFTVFYLFIVEGICRACGINWYIPAGPFPNINEQGVFSVWKKLADIPTSEKNFQLPLYLNFRAQQNNLSPGLGVRGFTLALTDANAMALDERTFLIYTPAGRYKLFTRDKKNPAILHSSGNWKGEITDDTLTIYSDCGDRLRYYKGAIAELQVKNQKFTYIRSGDRITEIREGGKVLLSVARDPLNGNLRINLPFQRTIVMELADRPVVSHIAGSNVVSAKIPAVKSLTLADGEKSTWDFSVTDRFYPSLLIDGKKSVWNPKDGTLIKDGEWSYDIEQKESPFSDATITRRSTIGKSEYLNNNKWKGVKTEIDSDGVKTVTTRFTSGVSRGSIRSIEITNGERLISRSSFSYDEEGLRIREVFEKDGKRSIVQFQREVGKDGSRFTRAISDTGTTLWEKIQYPNGSTRETDFSTERGKTDQVVFRDKEGRLSYRQDDRGFEYRNIYDATGKLQAILHSDKIQRRFFYDPMTNELAREVRFIEGGNIVVAVKDYIQGSVGEDGPQGRWFDANQLSPDIRDSLVKEAANFMKQQYIYQ